MEPAITAMIEPVFLDWGIPAGAAPVVSVVVSVSLATVLSMIVGELYPKNLALSAPRTVIKVVAPFQLAFTWIFAPFIWLLVKSANAIVRLFGVEPKEELSSARTAEELASAVRHSSIHGGLEEDTATLLGKALSFAQHQAQDIMTPRTRVATVKVGESADDIIALARKTGFSRFPVIDEDADDVVLVDELGPRVEAEDRRHADEQMPALG